MLLPEILPLHQTVIYVLTYWGQAVARIGSLVGPFSTNKMLTAYKRHFLDTVDIELFLRPSTTPNPLIAFLALRFWFREIYEENCLHVRSVSIPTVAIACPITAMLCVHHSFEK